MASRLRRREEIPEGTPIEGILKDVKLEHGRFSRQIATNVLVTKGESEGKQYRGTQFPEWFSFAKDADGEEYIPYGGPVYQVLAMADPNIDEILDDDELTDKKYEQWLKKTVKELEGFEFMARAGIKRSMNKDGTPILDKNGNPKKRQQLEPGSFGPIEEFEDLDMGQAS